MASFDNISSAAARSLKLSGRASVANTSCTLYSNPSSDGNSLMPPITNKGSAPSTSSSLIPIQKSLRVPNYDNLSLQHNISSKFQKEKPNIYLIREVFKYCPVDSTNTKVNIKIYYIYCTNQCSISRYLNISNGIIVSKFL